MLMVHLEHLRDWLDSVNGAKIGPEIPHARGVMHKASGSEVEICL